MSTISASSDCQWLDFVKAVALASKLTQNDLLLDDHEDMTSDLNKSTIRSSVGQDINRLKELLSHIYNNRHEEKVNTAMPDDIEEHSVRNKNPCNDCKQSRKKVRYTI